MPTAVILSESESRARGDEGESKDPEDAYTKKRDVGSSPRKRLDTALQGKALSGSFDFAPLSIARIKTSEALRSG
jgi:hypothetical protein